MVSNIKTVFCSPRCAENLTWRTSNYITEPKSEVESSNAEVTRVPSRMRKAGDDSAVEVFPIIHEFAQLSQIRTKTTCAHPAKIIKSRVP